MKFVFVLSLMACATAAQATEATHIEKQVKSLVVKIPQLGSFAPACESNKLFAERVSATTPKQVVLLTCFVEAKKWAAYLGKTGTDLYPMISIAVSDPASGIKYTSDDFKKLRVSVKEKLGELVAKTDWRKEYEKQDQDLAKTGVKATRENAKVGLQGFFRPAGETKSFSYLTVREFDEVRAAKTIQRKQVSAISLIHFSDSLLTLTVVDQFDEEEKGQRAREITEAWLSAYRALNE